MTDRRVRKALWKFVHRRSLEDTVEGRPLEGSEENLSVGVVWLALLKCGWCCYRLMAGEVWKTPETVDHYRNLAARAHPL